jgi:hypothetical protein
VLNWITWIAFAIELVVMLAVVPDRRLARLSREVFSVVSVVILIVGIGFVALLTGAFAQRFLSPEIAEVEEVLEAEQASAEQLALRELRGWSPSAAAELSPRRRRRSSPPAPSSRRGRAGW